MNSINIYFISIIFVILGQKAKWFQLIKVAIHLLLSVLLLKASLYLGLNVYIKRIKIAVHKLLPSNLSFLL